jgi:hypothetical protein
MSNIVKIEKKRRGRKGKQSAQGGEKEYIINSTKKKQDKNEDIILKLNITKADFTDDIKPYNATNKDFIFLQDKNKIETKEEIEIDEPELIIKDDFIKENGYIQKKNHKIQIEFNNSNKKIPISTSVACYNCCHTFNSIPIGIPVRKINSKYYIEGVYCSFNCCARAIFDNYENPWESYSLLMLMNKELNELEKLEKIKLAPPKNTLKMFGGMLDIKEYRNNFTTNDKYYSIIAPPIISMVPTIEENNLNYKYNKSKTEINGSNSNSFLFNTFT